MKEQTKCREHTEMFLCLKKEGHSDTGSNLCQKERKKILHGTVSMRRVLEVNGGDGHTAM